MDKYWETNCAIRWIEIYAMNSVIHVLNNWVQVCLFVGYYLSRQIKLSIPDAVQALPHIKSYEDLREG